MATGSYYRLNKHLPFLTVTEKTFEALLLNHETDERWERIEGKDVLLLGIYPAIGKVKDYGFTFEVELELAYLPGYYDGGTLDFVTYVRLENSEYYLYTYPYLSVDHWDDLYTMIEWFLKDFAEAEEKEWTEDYVLDRATRIEEKIYTKLRELEKEFLRFVKPYVEPLEVVARASNGEVAYGGVDLGL